MKGKYDKLECRACNIEEENQQHIVICEKLNQDKTEVEYKKLFSGTVREKLKIARKFNENYRILEAEKD